MTTNVGNIDRILRAAFGALLLILAFASGLPLFDGVVIKYAAALIGIVLIATALIRVCPLYSIFGIKTCRT